MDEKTYYSFKRLTDVRERAGLSCGQVAPYAHLGLNTYARVEREGDDTPLSPLSKMCWTALRNAIRQAAEHHSAGLTIDLEEAIFEAAHA